MKRISILTMALAWGMSTAGTLAASDPTATTRQAEEVLADLMAIPGKQIPQKLLAEAQGVAVIPNVVKIGFIAGARRGHGVVMVRDAEGEWSLPQFITLTGGSVGWQAGVQGTDVVLVFTTRKSVEGLMKGKFTIGADAAATAGPVGRNAAAATDAALKAEILSYSRSRGLFLGVSIDGSALEVDHEAHALFYGSRTGELPKRVPESAAQFRQYLVELTPAANAGGPALIEIDDQAAAKQAAKKVETLRRSLTQNAAQLQTILSPTWRQYLALPKELSEPEGRPAPDALTTLESRFTKIESAPNYKQLVERPEFQATHELLREYIAAMSAGHPTLELPPPPK